ncbi:hypothetical protein Afil01_21590 [Actinorhabdospora filicis]|uniref:NB-ARC domain-containing protein n=1 Tax=Actinorhabdospora filicis TaxID=1785913 RepID=A0A9W6SK01_9ACTN|nr:hypothetical protein [Actinorhabdospora filicis]GLZ77352.1 hypothetical protein Afil01_21590 [Actinorhabdospora filicis]
MWSVRWTAKAAAALVAALAVFAATWWAAEGPAGLDRGSALSLAGVTFAAAGAVVAVLLNRWEQQASRATGFRVLCGPIPPRPAGYRARQDVQHTLTAIPGIAVLTGGPGVGKSTEAAEHARTALRKGHRVAWIGGENPEQIVTALGRVADAYGRREPELSPQAAAERGLALLSEPPGRDRVLVVFDNVVDPTPVRAWLPRGERTRVVLTTTERGAAALGSTVDVERFTREQARAYLRERTGLPVDEAADELIVEVDGLPLALAQAASRMKETGRDFADYVADLRTFDVDEALPHGAWDDYPRSVAAAILLAVARIWDERTAPVLAGLALLAPTGLPVAMLGEILGEDEREVELAVARARTASLVDGDGGRVLMHRLTQRVIRGSRHETAELIPVLAERLSNLLDPPEQDSWAQRDRLLDLDDQAEALSANTGPDRRVLGDLLLARLGVAVITKAADRYVRQMRDMLADGILTDPDAVPGHVGLIIIGLPLLPPEVKAEVIAMLEAEIDAVGDTVGLADYVLLAYALHGTDRAEEAVEIADRVMAAEAWPEVKEEMGTLAEAMFATVYLATRPATSMELLEPLAAAPPDDWPLGIGIPQMLLTAYFRQERWEDCVRYGPEVLRIQWEHFGSGHPDLVPTLCLLAVAMDESGLPESAASYADQAIRIAEASPVPIDFDTEDLAFLAVIRDRGR